NSGPVVAFHMDDTFSRSGRLLLQGIDTLLDLAPNRPLLELRGKSIQAGWEGHVEINAQGLVVQPDVRIAAVHDPLTGVSRPLEATGMSIGGLITGEFHFPESGSPDDLCPR